MIITYDTSKLTAEHAEHLAQFETFRAHACWSLAAAVPVEHEAALERQAERHEATAKTIRAEIKAERDAHAAKIAAMRARRTALPV